MESNKSNPILNFRLGEVRKITEDLDIDIIGGMKRNVDSIQIFPAGSFITLTREATDSTESAE